MRYTLMHKEIPVLDMDLDEATSSVQKIAAVYQPRHLPTTPWMTRPKTWNRTWRRTMLIEIGEVRPWRKRRAL